MFCAIVLVCLVMLINLDDVFNLHILSRNLRHALRR